MVGTQEVSHWIVMDIPGWVLSSQMLQSGIKKAAAKWAMKDASILSRWDGRLQVTDQFSFFKGIPRDPSWEKGIKFFMNCTDKYRVSNIVHLQV